jgi:hypothetical protein
LEGGASVRIDSRALRLLVLLLAFSACIKVAAFDWGGGLEEKSGTSLPFNKLSSGTFDQTETFRLWMTHYFSPSASLLLKANAADVLTVGYAPNSLANSFTADLDTLVFSAGPLVVGRTIYRDFGNTILNTTLDGAQYTLNTPKYDLTILVGYTGFVFKSGSTVVISQADLNDRTVAEDVTKPSTLFAPSRAVGYFEADFPHLLADQKLMLAEAVQVDLRGAGIAKDGDPHSNFTPGATAPVHMSYTGLGVSGRIIGPLYWDFWAYAGLGMSLTATGPFAQATVNPGPPPTTVPEVLQTWKTSYIVNGIGNLDLTLLLPDANDLIVNLGVMLGSWDPDGIAPDQNLPTTPNGGYTPSQYTGYFGISRTGSALIFNPQPVNMGIVQLLFSVKPFAGATSDLANVQVTASAFVFVRPTSGPIAESGIDPSKSDLYVASEGDINVLWRPASDWGANLGVGVFVPGPAMTRGIEMRAQMGFNLSF